MIVGGRNLFKHPMGSTLGPDAPLVRDLPEGDEPAGAAVLAPAEASSGEDLIFVDGEAATLDPRLQRLIAVGRTGGTTTATASSEPGEVPVIARVSDVDAWESLSEVRVGVTVEQDGAEKDWIVTGRIPLERIKAVREQPFVLSLKAPQDLRPSLAAGTQEALARPAQLPPRTKSKGGAGVVVGIIDYGCDFAHRNFRDAGGTRIEAIWRQGGATQLGAPFGYGRVYTRAQINAALQTANPYSTLGYAPAADTPSSRGSHGTHVMDIAAGSGGGSGAAGFAPEATIVFVDVRSDTYWSGSDVVGETFGDSVSLLEAIQFIFARAGTRPCVINISLGTNGGPHDGTTLVERGVDRLLSAAPNRAVVIAASNSYADHIHASGAVPADGAVDLVWDRPPNTALEDELEVWYAGADRLAVELIKPDGVSLGLVEPGLTGEVHQYGALAALISNRLGEPNNGDNTIGLFIGGGLPFGRWTVRLHERRGSAAGFHAWIERDDRSQAAFVDGVDTHTIGSISCGRKTIVVGSYDAHKAATPLSYFSSAGPTRDGRQKPELSAPGHDVSAAHSRTGRGVVRKSGTSMAAPAVTGAVALLLAEATARRRKLSVDQIRQSLADTARPSGAAGWDPRYGKGRLNVAALLRTVLAGAAPVKTPTAKTPTATKAASAARRRNGKSGAEGVEKGLR